MARTATRAQLRTRLEQRADITNDQSVSTAEKNDLINEALCEVYDELVAAAPPDYYLTTAPTIVTVDGTLAYDLPEDFYKLRSVQVDTGSNRRRGLWPMQPDERLVLGPTAGGDSVILEYIPACPVLDDDADTFDGVNGWEELAVVVAAIKVKVKKSLDPSPLMALEARARDRIQRMANRDAGSPGSIHRTSLRDARFPGWSQATTHYRIRGIDTIELYRVIPGYP